MHVGSRARSPPLPHRPPPQASARSRATFFFFHLSDIIYQSSVSSSAGRVEGGMWGAGASGLCWNVSGELQGTSPTRPPIPYGSWKRAHPRPVSPPGRSCHVSRGVPLLSFTLIGRRSGASVGSRRSSRLHRSSPSRKAERRVSFNH